MRKRDYDFKPVVIGELAPGDVIANRNGRTYRIVVAVSERELVVRIPGGGADVLPVSSVEGYWLKAVSKPYVLEEVVDGGVSVGDILFSKKTHSRRDVVAINGDEIVLRSPSGVIRPLSFSAVEEFWYKAVPR